MDGRRAVTGVTDGSAGRHGAVPAGSRSRLRASVRAAGWTSVLLLLLTAASLGVVGLVCLFPIVVELCGVVIPAMRQERTAPERWAAIRCGLRARPWLLSTFWVVVGGGLPLLGAIIANEVAPHTVTRAALTDGTK